MSQDCGDLLIATNRLQAAAPPEKGGDLLDRGSVEYMRVLPERVPELVAQGWHPGACSRFNAGLRIEVVMVRERPTLRDLTPEAQYRLLALAASGAEVGVDELRRELGLVPKETT